MGPMRVGGIASGMDIEGMVTKLMEAERMPLTRLKQQQTQLTWKRDAYRNINSKLLELDQMMLDMKLSSTYKPKSVSSSEEGAVTATASSGATNGTYRIQVSSLATNEMLVSQKNVESNMTFTDKAKEYTFQTFNENGEPETHSFTVEENDSLKQVLQKIKTASNGRVQAFYDETSKQVVMESSRTGVYNPDTTGTEIMFDANNTLFTDVFGMEVIANAQNATFTYNGGLELESRDNSYSLNGIHFEFKNVTAADARITVSSNVDQAFDTIKKFVDTYNEVIEMMNTSQTEEKYRDYKPLTEEQKAEMTDKQIEQWEEKAKSGILRGESSIRDGMLSLRQGLQGLVETDGAFQLLSQIGISTTKNYMDGGKLEINEEELKTALRENPDDVFALFSNNVEGGSRGVIHRFDDALGQLKGTIEGKAGKSTHTLENYTLGKQMKDLNERITDFEKRMVRVEQRYWSQFTQMEKAISRLNQQADYLYSQFSG